MSKEVVKCCFNCKYYHFFTGTCDKLGGKMPPHDLKLPCENFYYKGGKNDNEGKTRQRL